MEHENNDTADYNTATKIIINPVFSYIKQHHIQQQSNTTKDDDSFFFATRFALSMCEKHSRYDPLILLFFW